MIIRPYTILGIFKAAANHLPGRNIQPIPPSSFGHCHLIFTSMRLACKGWTPSTIIQEAEVSLFRTLVVKHVPNHQPPATLKAQFSASNSLSRSGVLNCFQLALWKSLCSLIASPASPLYWLTDSRYLPASSLMVKVEYSAEYHRPLTRWIYPHAVIRDWRPLSKQQITIHIHNAHVDRCHRNYSRPAIRPVLSLLY